jgi:hypothetical protein
MTVYHNEIDPFAAQWLRNLIKKGLIADGEVDTRSILDVRAVDLAGFAQCHFFAGIGGWSYALRRAGWPDDRPVWTGSCPCQPFSLAGKQKGFDDARHLWPVWRDLIAIGRPAKVFGEQVASATEWLGLVRSDLEALGYAVGAMPIQAASAGADHLRDRYWFVADADGLRGQANPDTGGSIERSAARPVPGPGGAGDGALADAASAGPFPGAHAGIHSQQEGARPRDGEPERRGGDDLEWVIGADGKARRVGPDLRGLVDGLSEFLAGLRPEWYIQGQNAVRKYGQENASRSAEVLRDVWQGVLSQPASYEAMGEPSGVRGAEILLPFLCELGRRSEEGDGTFQSAETFNDAMRSLRFSGEAERPSLRWKLSQQRGGEYPDALHGLSLVLAQHARTAWDAHKRQNAKALRLLEHGVTGRVGKLRGFGNAIDPRCGAEFIKAAMAVAP